MSESKNATAGADNASGNRQSGARPLWIAIIFAGALAALMATDSWIGITYDEPIYQSKSVQALKWLNVLLNSPSLAADSGTIDTLWKATDQHPGFYKLATAICGATLGRLVGYDAAWRTGTNLMAAICIAALYAFVAAIWGHPVGLYAAGALFLMPRVFGHCHLAALDAPMMAMSFLTVFATWKACTAAGEADSQKQADRRAWVWAVIAGVIFGKALGTKLNAFFLPVVIFPWVLLFARRHWKKLAVSFAIFGPAVFFATWPWLWHNTWARFSEYFLFHFEHYPISVLYFGTEYIRAPWHYPLVMTAITIPPSILLLFAIGIWRAGRLRAWLRNSDRTGRRRAKALALTLWALVVNLAPSCLPSAPKYGGVRLFLPIFPFIAIIAAAGFQWILEHLTPIAQQRLAISNLRVKLAGVALFLALIGPLSAISRFTPYYLSYYNIMIGGLPGAAKAGMEPTYWGDTYQTAALWLAEHAERKATVWIEPKGFESTVRLFELGPLRPDIQFTAGPDGLDVADYAVTQNKPTEFTDITGRLVAQKKPLFTDGIAGVPLIYVFEVD